MPQIEPPRRSPPIEVSTERLRLRQWRSSDYEPFAQINADPRVMERLHMRRAEATFEHPSVPEGSSLREHCLYRLTYEQWREPW
jgi:RimJ/RimL family protein N-acetyltransferase